MTFGIADLSIIPMRREPSERSEMVSQILFGELFETEEETERWLFVRLLHDDYKGWIDRKMCREVTADYVESYRREPQVFTSEVFNIVTKEGDYAHKLIVPGSVLPFLEIATGKMAVGEDPYTLLTKLKDAAVDHMRDLLIEYALMYYNTPYLWGGRTPYGIDCSGLAQMVYRLAGINIPRDASQQVLWGGEDLSFIEEALPGDLAFFGDPAGYITHVGILWKENRIIHASGRVRVDKIDHNGIFHEELKRYTHSLKIIKRLF